MKNNVKKLALVSFFAISACSSWFHDEEPLPADLSQRTPALNRAAGGFPDPNAPIDAMMPPMGGMGSMPLAPEPPAFIGSTGVQPFPTAAVSSTPIPAQSGAAGLPMMSPVDMSGANNSATGLPVQRRAPAFNQALGVSPQGSDGFPKLAQIPQAPTTPIPAQADSRVVQMKADLEASKGRVTPLPPLAQVTPIAPVAPAAHVSPEIDNRVAQMKADLQASKNMPLEMPKEAPLPPFAAPQPVALPSGPSTNFANLKPLPNQPIYKIADEPKVIAEKPRVLNTQGPGSMQTSQNITRLSDLRPISGIRRTGGSVYHGNNPAGGKARMGIARHSTYYGEY